MVTKSEISANPAPATAPVSLSKEEVLRYSRHLIMPEVGMEGQLKLKQAKVCASALAASARRSACISPQLESAASAWWISTRWIPPTCSARFSSAPKT